MRIKQVSLLDNYLEHKSEIDVSIAAVLDSGWYILGHNVSEFEKAFARFTTSKHAIGVANGTDAIEISLRSLGIGTGDIVFTVSHTAVATIAAIERSGAIPWLVDINPDTFTMDSGSLETAVEDTLKKSSGITGRPSAVVPVHLYGHPVDIDAVMKVAKQYNLKIIEDCAQAHGAEYYGRQVGSFGITGAFSFYPTKNLGALGDGGGVITSDLAVYAKLQAIRQYGWKERYISSCSGINTRLDELQAAVLNIKLKYLNQHNLKRCEIAAKYTDSIGNSSIRPPFVDDNVKHVFHQYVVKNNSRNLLMDYLKKKNIASAIHYPVPVHMQPAYKKKIAISSKGLANTENVTKEILSLPMFPQLSNREVDYVTSILSEYKGS